MAEGNGTALAEREGAPKEKVSAAQAVEIVKKFVKDRHHEDKTRGDRALAEANNFAGGASERLDKAAVDQGRQWAIRLALIARQTSGSGYQASKSGAAIAAIVKKIFGIVGDLDAMLATDVEIGLFEKVKDEDYFGWSGGGLKKFRVSELNDMAGPGETIDENMIVDQLLDNVGEKIRDEVEAMLDRYEIEPIVVAGEPENDEAKPARGGRRKAR